MRDKDNEPASHSFEAWIERMFEEAQLREADRTLAARQRASFEPLKEPSLDDVASPKPDRVEKQLDENFAKADAEYRTRYERLHGLFERIFRDPEDGVRRFNAIREARGEERALKILERKPQRISPTKDALRAYFQHSTRERESATAARLDVREAYRQTQEAEERQWDALLALRRYRNRQERDRDRERER